MGFGPWIFRSCRANHAACVEAGRTNRIIGANVIPAQMAGKIARDAGLADQSGYCPIDPESMKSKVDANIFVVGDAAIPGDMPKSTFAANSQAKVAAMVIRAELTQSRAFPARYSNTCWSLIAPDDDIKIGASYEPGEGKIKQITGFVSQKGEPADVRKQNYKESVDWYNGIVADGFRLIKTSRFLTFQTAVAWPPFLRCGVVSPMTGAPTWLQIRALHGQTQSFPRRRAI